MSITAAIGIPKFDAGPQKSKGGKRAHAQSKLISLHPYKLQIQLLKAFSSSIRSGSIKDMWMPGI